MRTLEVEVRSRSSAPQCIAQPFGVTLVALEFSEIRPYGDNNAP